MPRSSVRPYEPTLREHRYGVREMTSSSPPATRDLTPKGRITRDRILRAAADVLIADGVQGFSLDKVRREASVSGSQLNHYFDDRRHLVREVVRRQAATVLDFHRQPTLGALDTFAHWDRWAQLNTSYLHRTGFHGAVTYHGLAGQLAKSDDTVRETLAEGYWRWISLLEDSFARMRSRGALVEDVEPRSLALAVVALHQGAGLLSFAFREEWPLADVTRMVVNHVRGQAADPADRTRRPPPRVRRRRRRPPRPDVSAGFTIKGATTRKRIVAGAAELFSERGVQGTSMEDVRRAVGVSGSQLSHYFADKDDLIGQVVLARTQDVVDFHGQPELGRLDRMASLRAWAELCWTQSGAVYLRNGCIYGALAGQLLEAGEPVLDDVAAGYDRWIGIFRDGLTAMRARGDLTDAADPRHLAVAIVAAHQGGALLAHVTGDGQPYHAAVSAALDHVAVFTPAGRTTP